MQTGTRIGACDNRGPEGYGRFKAGKIYQRQRAKHTKRAKTPQARQNTPSAPKHTDSKKLRYYK